METDKDKKGDKKKISNLLSPKNLKKAKKRKTREEKNSSDFRDAAEREDRTTESRHINKRTPHHYE